MGATTFSGPVRSGLADRETIGWQTTTQQATYVFTDTGSFATTIIIPAYSHILQIGNTITTAWDSGTSDALEIGTLADPDAFADVADLQTAGLSPLAVDATQAAAILNVGSTDVTLYLTITSVGGAATAGAATIYAQYLQAINDPKYA